VTGFLAGILIEEGGSGTGVNRFHDLAISQIWYGPGLGFSGGEAHDIIVGDVSTTAMVGSGFFCDHCTVRNVTVRDSFVGISLSKASATNCTATGNIHDGIFLRYSSLIGGTSNDNGGSGVRADFGSAVIGVAVSDNGNYGINLASGGNCNAVNCTGGNNSPANVSGCGDGNGCHQNYLP
jgi:hypothetical protein